MKTAKNHFLPIRRLAFALAVSWSGLCQAQPELPAIFSEGMVLQRSDSTPVWGNANPGELLTITLGTLRTETRADASGQWRTDLDLAGVERGPFELKIESPGGKLSIPNVLVGQVWLCSGQSNMAFTLNRVLDADKEIAGSANSEIRQFEVSRRASPSPLPLLDKGSWETADPKTSGGFTAVGYFFAKAIHSETGEPVGLINATWGGSPVETWISYASLSTNPKTKAAADTMREEWEGFPERRREYAKRLREWAAKHGRADRKEADPKEFAGVGVSTEGWTPVSLPGKPATAGLPDSGALWLRRTLSIPDSMAGKSLPVTIDDIYQFDAFYWNGELVGQTDLDNQKGERKEGAGSAYAKTRYYKVPANLVRAGENTLAIRLFTPFSGFRIGGGRFQGESSQRVSFAGEWMAKSEFSLPPLEGAAAEETPGLLTSAPREIYVPSALFNGMISPLLPYGIQGVLWYQGESNADGAAEYGMLFEMLISDWRKQWGRGDFPFYFCQLPAHKRKQSEPVENGWAELREAQASVLKLPNTAQAVLVDLGEADDIHPRDKTPVGERLAAIALDRNYHKPRPHSGPVYKSHRIEGRRIRIDFTETEGGLQALPLPETYLLKSHPKEEEKLIRNTPGSQLEGFAICGKDQKWVWADARIEGDTVVVESPRVPEPVAVRYAWANNPTVNLVNAAGLPAAPFRTDDFPPPVSSK